MPRKLNCKVRISALQEALVQQGRWLCEGVEREQGPQPGAPTHAVCCMYVQLVFSPRS